MRERVSFFIQFVKSFENVKKWKLANKRNSEEVLLISVNFISMKLLSMRHRLNGCPTKFWSASTLLNLGDRCHVRDFADSLICLHSHHLIWRSVGWILDVERLRSTCDGYRPWSLVKLVELGKWSTSKEERSDIVLFTNQMENYTQQIWFIKG